MWASLTPGASPRSLKLLPCRPIVSRFRVIFSLVKCQFRLESARSGLDKERNRSKCSLRIKNKWNRPRTQTTSQPLISLTQCSHHQTKARRPKALHKTTNLWKVSTDRTARLIFSKRVTSGQQQPTSRTLHASRPNLTTFGSLRPRLMRIWRLKSRSLRLKTSLRIRLLSSRSLHCNNRNQLKSREWLSRFQVLNNWQRT